MRRILSRGKSWYSRTGLGVVGEDRAEQVPGPEPPVAEFRCAAGGARGSRGGLLVTLPPPATGSWDAGFSSVFAQTSV